MNSPPEANLRTRNRHPSMQRKFGESSHTSDNVQMQVHSATQLSAYPEWTDCTPKKKFLDVSSRMSQNKNDDFQSLVVNKLPDI